MYDKIIIPLSIRLYSFDLFLLQSGIRRGSTPSSAASRVPHFQIPVRHHQLLLKRQLVDPEQEVNSHPKLHCYEGSGAIRESDNIRIRLGNKKLPWHAYEMIRHAATMLNKVK